MLEPQIDGDVSGMDKMLDDELAERRERFKWLDGRYGWSTGGSLGILYFMFVNAVPVAKFAHYPNYLVMYLITWVVGLGLALVSLSKVGTGMLAFALWSKRTRETIGCTSLLWDDNVVENKRANEFAGELLSMHARAIREAKAQEIWRLSFLNRSRERDLMWSRLFTVLLGMDAVAYAIAVLTAAGHIQFAFH